MVTSGRLTRYNPHQIQKQAAKWPVLFFNSSLAEDITFRTRQLWNKAPPGWVEPASNDITAISADLAQEYGIDAVRLAIVSAQNQNAEPLLESSFKWLAGIFASFSSITNSFSEDTWLETAYQMHDHIINRHNFHAGLAALKKAHKNSRPGSNISPASKNLVLSCLSAFAPYLAGYLAGMPEQAPLSFIELTRYFDKFTVVRLGFERGGWSWHVFKKHEFAIDAASQIQKIRWVRASIGARSFELKQEGEGIRICLSRADT